MRGVIVGAGWVVGWLLLWRPAALARARSGAGAATAAAHPGRVAVVIPARDEADRLPRLLGSLAAQVPPVDEVVVVDDHSRDATAEVAAAAGATVVAAPPLPDGWTGKSWACAVGVDATTAEHLVLLDADVVLAPDAVARARAAHAERGGLLSVQPRHDVDRPVEALSLVFNVVAVMALGLARPFAAMGGWGAAGPLLVTTRADYEAAGGHRAVRGDVAEDLALAARYRAAGLAVRCVLGGAVVRFRMYRDLRGLVRGWSKNMATGARRTPPLLGLATFLWVSGMVAAFLWVLGEGRPLVAVALYAAVAVQVHVLGRVVGRFGPAAVAWPLLVTVFVLVVLWSAIATFVLRRVTWSDRTIELGRGEA